MEAAPREWPLFTRAEVAAKGASPDYLLVIIHNSVYDLTGYLHDHPGGTDVLMDFAGRDGTLGFEGVGHSKAAHALKEQFKVGELVPEDRVL